MILLVMDCVTFVGLGMEMLAIRSENGTYFSLNNECVQLCIFIIICSLAFINVSSFYDIPMLCEIFYVV